MRHKYLGFFFIFLVVLLVVFPFLKNPYLFDDSILFLTDETGLPAVGRDPLAPRWWIYKSFVWYLQRDGQLLWLRLGNIFLHFAVVIAFYAFARQLIVDALDIPRERASLAVFLSSVVLTVHPLAIYTQSYLVQRTVICASLFAVLSLFLFWRGLSGRRWELWGALLCFVFSIYSKEHVVMLPAVSLALLVLYVRSGMEIKIGKAELFAALTLQFVVSLWVVLSFKWLLASSYEIGAGEVMAGELEVSASLLYPVSVLNQALLFFKYLGLWILPNPLWVAIDMRENFPSTVTDPRLWLGGALFVTYCLTGSVLLWKGRLKGVLGLGLLMPAILFLTEFSTVRLQEIFVIYRSYLWVPGLFLVLATGLIRMQVRPSVILVAIVSIVYIGLAYDRLTVMSSPVLAWGEAKELMERGEARPSALGAYRIYYNLGSALGEQGRKEEAMKNYDQALARKPGYVLALLNRGIILLERKEWQRAYVDFDVAVQSMPNFIKPYIGRARALQGMGRAAEAQVDLEHACNMGAKNICQELNAGGTGND